MTDPSLTNDQTANLMPKKLWLFPNHDDDDDDDADDDDPDDDDKPAVLKCERWLSRPDFASPEWWSRT